MCENKTIRFIATTALCLLSLVANAQATMRIEFMGGDCVDYPVSSIKCISFTKDQMPTTPDNTPSGVEAVDLGLSVKWANMNIGATAPEDYGDYFAWGETIGYNGGKDTFNQRTYKYYMLTNTTDENGANRTVYGYTKYIEKASALRYGYDGFYDDKTVLDSEDDTAIANWGGSWRMPTKGELDELRKKCTWTWTTENGTNGYKVTGQNGNSIFLPAAGYRVDGSLDNVGSYGYFWSSSLNAGFSGYAYRLFFYPNSVSVNYFCRDYGFSVRAVCP